MERWSGRVAVVTGAGSGIGAATAKCLVKHGLKVVGIDYKNHLDIEETARELRNEPGELHSHITDITKEDEITEAFNWIYKTHGGVDILVNCAGVYYPQTLTDFNANLARQIYDVNVIGLSICTREALKSMKERGVDDGHIIHIASNAAHSIPTMPGLIVYTSSKHAIKVFVEGLRRELMEAESSIRVTCISPGKVNTNMMRNGVPNWKELPLLDPEDVADAVLYALSRPPKVQVYQLQLLPVGAI